MKMSRKKDKYVLGPRNTVQQFLDGVFFGGGVGSGGGWFLGFFLPCWGSNPVPCTC